VPLPRAGLEVRADGLWGELVCETPLEHWSVGLEAFGLAYDDPADAWGDEWGDRLPVGLDLEWEATEGPGDVPPAGPPVAAGGVPAAAEAVPAADGAGAVAFAQPGQVHGQLLVGPTQRIDFAGTGFRSRSSGLLDWWTARPHRRLAWVGPGGAGNAADPDERHPAVLGTAPVLVTAPGRPPVRLARALCRVDGAAGQDDGGVGWAEWLPAPASRDRPA
jgi:hypothetical protein